MQLKSFVAQDVKRALKLVSEELGPDAVILSNKKIPGGVEITAALDYDPDLYMQYSLQQKQQEAQSETKQVEEESRPTQQTDTTQVVLDSETGNAESSGGFGAILDQQAKELSESTESREWLRKYGKSIFRKNGDQKNPSGGITPPSTGIDKAREITASLKRKNKTLGSNVSSLSDHLQASPSGTASQGEIEALKQELLNLRTQLDSSENETPLSADNAERSVSKRRKYRQKANQALHADVNQAPVNMELERVTTTPSADSVYSAKASSEESDSQKIKKIAIARKKKIENQEKEIYRLQAELSLMKGLYETTVNQGQWEVLKLKQPHKVELYRRCRRLGLESELIKKVIDPLESDNVEKAYETALSHIGNSIRLFIPRRKKSCQISAIIGPTGVGKTTTVAKLAAQYAIKNGSEKLAIITTDIYRLGAFEQLKVLGKILNVPIRVANNQRHLGELIEALGKKELILIDSSGVTPGEDGWDEQLEQFASIKAPVDTFLVLPATAQEGVLRSYIDQYRVYEPNACIISKIDQAQSMGEVISEVIANALPVAYVAAGQQVPKDLEYASRERLIKTAEYLANRNLDELDLSFDYYDSHQARGKDANKGSESTNDEEDKHLICGSSRGDGDEGNRVATQIA